MVDRAKPITVRHSILLSARSHPHIYVIPLLRGIIVGNRLSRRFSSRGPQSRQTSSGCPSSQDDVVVYRCNVIFASTYQCFINIRLQFLCTFADYIAFLFFVVSQSTSEAPIIAVDDRRQSSHVVIIIVGLLSDSAMPDIEASVPSWNGRRQRGRFHYYARRKLVSRDKSPIRYLHHTANFNDIYLDKSEVNLSALCIVD